MKYYEDLYANPNDPPFAVPPATEPCPLFLHSEVQSALRGTRAATSPGLDGITSDMLRQMPELIPEITALFNQMLKESAVPDNFADSLTYRAAP